MNLRQIREECWGIARDDGLTDSDRMWSTVEMNRYINRVYRFIARETRCIRDSTTPALALIDVDPVDYTTLTPGTLDYIWANEAGNWLYHKDVTPYLLPLSPLIINIDECKWLGQPWPLRKVSCTVWQVNPWWERVLGIPTQYATDLETNKIAINFRAEEADKLQLTVRRMPTVDLVADDDVPEFKVQYHDFFVNGVLEQMYMKRDAETIDEAKSLDYGTRFLMDVDELKAQEEHVETRLRPNIVMQGLL
jgi:hypothetical protein